MAGVDLAKRNLVLLLDRIGLRMKKDLIFDGKVDVDFTLAVYTKTGKYFIGRDLIDNCSELIGDVYYWRAKLKKEPGYLLGRILGRFQHKQAIRTLNKNKIESIGRISRRPILHMDPLTILNSRLSPHDIVICHDVGPLTHPELFAPGVFELYDAIYKHMAKIGPHVAFVSHASRNMFNKILNSPALASSAVIYPPVRQIKTNDHNVEVGNIKTPFFLTVGAVGSRKNQLSSIKAFQLSKLHERGFSYVICGGKESGYEEVEEAAGSTPGVILLPYVSEGTLNWLYKSAVAFVLMSKLEGFGIPVAEAIAHGLIPLVSRDSVLHEVSGDGAVLADENDVQDIAHSMRMMVTMSDEERALRRKSLGNSIQRFKLETFTQEWTSFIKAALNR